MYNVNGVYVYTAPDHFSRLKKTYFHYFVILQYIMYTFGKNQCHLQIFSCNLFVFTVLTVYAAKSFFWNRM